MKTKITHLTSVHSRYDTRIFIKMCTSLAKMNHYDVSLVVADGKGDEVKNNVHFFDVGKREKSRLSRITKTVRKVFLKAKELDSDIYHFHDPELIPIGRKLKKLGKKVIFDIHENTDLQILQKDWIPLYLRKIISFIYVKYENYNCKKFDLLIVPQKSMHDKYKNFSKTILIFNFPHQINVDSIDLLSNIDKYHLLYSGSVGEARGIWNMLNLIEELQKIDKRYKLTIAGKIEKSLLEKVKNHNAWEYTEYLGLLTKEQVYKVYRNNTIGLILFNNVGQYYMAYSLKLFEYMQNGMLVIMPNFGDWLEFNNKFKVGLNVDTSNPKEIAEQIHQLNLEDILIILRNNIIQVNKYFIWESQEKQLIESYEKLICSIK